MKYKNNLNNWILEKINNNLKDIFILLLIFLLGIILGVLFVNNTSDYNKEKISTYINTFIVNMQEQNIDTKEILKLAIGKDFILVFLIWISGCSVIGIPILYGVIAFKGFSLGYTISSILAVLGTKNGIVIAISSLCLQNIISIPAIICLGTSGVKLYHSIIRDKRKENIKIEILKHTINSCLICLFLLISSFVEIYISNNLTVLFSKYI